VLAQKSLQPEPSWRRHGHVS